MKILSNKIIDYYQSVLSVVAVLIFFTDLHLYLHKVGVISFSPIIFVIVFSISSIPLLILKKKYISKYILAWCGIYIGFSSLSFLLVRQTEMTTHELQLRWFSTILLIANIIIFSGNEIVRLWAVRAVLIVTLINIGNNIYEFLNPFVSFGALNETGRAAGYYIDPNKSGAALILGMIFGVSFLPRKYRILFILLVGLGVLTTFSRGSILVWIICVIIMFSRRVILVNDLWKIFFPVLLTIVIGYQFGQRAVSNLQILDVDMILNPNVVKRMNWLKNKPSSEAHDNSRLKITHYSWNTFSRKPFLGYGIAHTRQWNQILPHNMYLLLMVEHGFLGALLIPLLIYAVTKNAKGEVKNIALLFTFFMFMWGFFNHRMLEERFQLIMFSLMAALSIHSYENQILGKK